MKHSKAQILVTLGPASTKPDILKSLFEHQMDAARLNLSWGTLEEKENEIKMVRELSSKDTPIIVDLPGPRIQKERGHTFDKSIAAITEKDKEYIRFAASHDVDYVAVSFVSSQKDMDECRMLIREAGGKQKIMAKIERREALDDLKAIVKSSDAVMVARGDLAENIPLEKLPFAEDAIIKTAKKYGKPVIVATEMLFSMTDRPSPTRAEIIDVANAILKGADAVMLSEETAIGKYPVEAVTVMEKIVLEAEKHVKKKTINILRCKK